MLDAPSSRVYLRAFAMPDPDRYPDRPEVPLTTRRLRDLPPAEYPPIRATHDGIWNRPDRPKLVGIVGWICAAVGYLAFILKGGTLVRYFSDMKWLNPNYVAPVLTRNQYAAEVFLVLADMAVGLLAIAAGLGALKVREWGRRLLIWYAIAALVVGLLKAIYQFASFDSMLDHAIAASTQPVDRPTAENREFFFLISATLMMAIWPILVIVVATRRHVREAFARAAT